MSINVFEGSRRILYVVMASFAIVVIAIFRIDAPFVAVTYRFAGPTSPPVRADCMANDSRHSETMTSQEGHEIFVSGCFQVVADPDGSPFNQINTQRIPGAPPELIPDSGSHADEYEAARLREAFTPIESAAADREFNQKRREQWGVALAIIAGGVTFLWVLALAIGWVVRGFMGIPRGADLRRPSE